MALGISLPVNLDKDTKDKMKRTVFVYEDRRGRLRISPIIQEVLTDIVVQSIKDAKYVGIDINAEIASLVSGIEQIQGRAGIQQRDSGKEISGSIRKSERDRCQNLFELILRYEDSGNGCHWFRWSGALHNA